MARVDITVEVCGMAGDGTIAAGGMINEALSLGGFFVLGFDSYPAEIRGFGRCVTRSRIGDEAVVALEDIAHVLISLDDAQSRSRINNLSEEAAVFFDGNPPSYVEEGESLAALVEPGVRLFPMPLADLATAAAGTARGRNLTAIGGFAAVFGIPADLFRTVIARKFKPKGDAVLSANLRSFDVGYDYALEHFRDRITPILEPRGERAGEEKVMISGNTAIATAALDAGLKLYFGYPITPATPIMEQLAKKLPDRGGRMVQMEDEISSIGAVLGAGFAGERAMTATSGPGLALMTELITHGVMAETPAVIIDAQRGGPSTGLPTKTEQSDLHAAVHGGPGDAPRIVIAPTNVRECYELTAKSFQLAEKYQTPVIVLTDFYLDNRVESISMPRLGPSDVEDWNVYPDPSQKGHYRRFELTENGISPRAKPGMEGFAFSATGLEHGPNGTPDYSPDNHMIMSAKRYRKIHSALADLPKPEEFSDGGKFSVGVIGWGSTFGSVLEAVNMAKAEGMAVAALKILSLYPLHEEIIREFMGRCDKVIVPELNFEGQLRSLIAHLDGREIIGLNRVTGTPFPPSIILEKIKSVAGGSAQ